MKRGIDAAPELAAWTHRDADDPGIALLEGAALLGDILSFYQEHYANEAYLRTAAWRESVAELVRLDRLPAGAGHRRSRDPGLRGARRLAGERARRLSGEGRSRRPAQAGRLPDRRRVASPGRHLGRFNLYRPRRYLSTLAAGATSFELASVDGAGDATALAAFELKPGDRLLLQPQEPSWTSSGSTLSAQKAPQVVKVKKVTALLGRIVVDLDAPLRASWNQPVAAWRINRTFRHLGHNAPPKTVSNLVGYWSVIVGAVETDTRFSRHVGSGGSANASSATIDLPPALLPLDAEVSDLLPGMRVIVQTAISVAAGTPVPLCVVRAVNAVEARTIGFGNLVGPSTLLTLDASLIRHVDAGRAFERRARLPHPRNHQPAIDLAPAVGAAQTVHSPAARRRCASGARRRRRAASPGAGCTWHTTTAATSNWCAPTSKATSPRRCPTGRRCGR